jgi:predicted  nucleic acid-binding Zn-ribbon protein
MNLPSKLFELQKVADKLYAAQKRIFDIDQILKNNKELHDATLAYELAKKDAGIKEMHVKQKAEEEKELQHKIEFSESTLYSGMVKNPKELQDLQKELSSLKKRAKQIENDHLELISSFDDANNIKFEKETELAKVNQTLEVLFKDLSAEKTELERQIKIYNQEYLVTSTDLPADIKTVFENLFRTKKGKAVAVIDEGTCSVCGLSIRESQIQQIKSSNQIVYCPSCGRMLFIE